MFGVLAADAAYALGGDLMTGVFRGETETDGLFCMATSRSRGDRAFEPHIRALEA